MRIREISDDKLLLRRRKKESKGRVKNSNGAIRFSPSYWYWISMINGKTHFRPFQIKEGFKRGPKERERDEMKKKG